MPDGDDNPSDPLPECDPGKCVDTDPTISPDLGNGPVVSNGDDSEDDEDTES